MRTCTYHVTAIRVRRAEYLRSSVVAQPAAPFCRGSRCRGRTHTNGGSRRFFFWLLTPDFFSSGGIPWICTM
jgi:hypothetical protein